MNKERINVAVRLRPFTLKEQSTGERPAVTVKGNSVFIDTDELAQNSVKSSTVAKLFNQMKRFDFENCFGPAHKTDEIYQGLIRELVSVSMRGINGTLFMYGQTGSGKTFTVTGDLFEKVRLPALDKSPVRERVASPFKKLASAEHDFSDRDLRTSGKSLKDIREKAQRPREFNSPNINRQRRIDPSLFLKKGEAKHDGLLQMGLRDIFAQVASAADRGEKFFVRCSYVEIYNEYVFDLLRENAEQEASLGIYEDVEKGEFYVKNACEKIIDTFEAALEVLAFGEANRHFASTCLNHHSSRSHTLFRIFFEYIDAEERAFESVCNFVDLAGSEKLTRYENEADQSKLERIKESKSINKSLFFLTQIINMKSSMKSETFVPYRNSPLTKILKNSIGGNAKTVIVLCIHPSLGNLEQTLGTLKFGNLAKSIVNTVCKNSLVSVHENQEAIALAVKNYQEKILKLEESLKNGLTSSELYQGKIAELEEQKRLLLERYRRLVEVTTKGAAKVQDGQQFYSVEHCSEIMKSCGLLDFYRVTSKTEVNLKGQKKILEGGFFSKGLEYTSEVFLSEVVAAKQRRIEEVERQSLILKERLREQAAENAALKGENAVVLRLLRVLLNSNEPDTRLFDQAHLNALVLSSLQLIDNAKSEIINQTLRKNELRQSLAYNENSQEQLSVGRLIPHFSELIKIEAERKQSANSDLPIIEKVKRVSCRDPNFHKKSLTFAETELKAMKEDFEFEEIRRTEKIPMPEVFNSVDKAKLVSKTKGVSSDFLLRD